MTVITRMRRTWYRKQGRLPPEDFQAIVKMRHTFCQRAGETEAEWRARLKRQNDEFMARTDRDDDEAL